MKKAAVATTTARGTAVSSSRITAVQSVYTAASPETMPSSQQSSSLLVMPADPQVSGSFRLRSLGPWSCLSA